MSEIKPPKVTVIELKRIETEGNLRALATIKIGPLEILKCRLIRVDGQSPFVSPPQEMWTDRDGKKKYFPLCKWPKEWAEVINTAVVTAYESGA